MTDRAIPPPDKVSEAVRLANPHLFPTPATQSAAAARFDALATYSSEKQLQDDVMRWLKANGAVGIVWQPMHKPANTKIGTADFVFNWHGKYACIECKIGKRIPTDEQLEFLVEVGKAGGIAFVAYSLEQVIEKLHGL